MKSFAFRQIEVAESAEFWLTAWSCLNLWQLSAANLIESQISPLLYHHGDLLQASFLLRSRGAYFFSC